MGKITSHILWKNNPNVPNTTNQIGIYGYWSKPWHLVNPKIAGKWMFIPLELPHYAWYTHDRPHQRCRIGATVTMRVKRRSSMPGMTWWADLRSNRKMKSPCTATGVQFSCAGWLYGLRADFYQSITSTFGKRKKRFCQKSAVTAAGSCTRRLWSKWNPGRKIGPRRGDEQNMSAWQNSAYWLCLSSMAGPASKGMLHASWPYCSPSLEWWWWWMYMGIIPTRVNYLFCPAIYYIGDHISIYFQLYIPIIFILFPYLVGGLEQFYFP